MDWNDFKEAAPELAKLGEERFENFGLVLVGTIRQNGWPRISPVEPLILDGELYLGMSWRSRKALDLLRDPRCTVHSVVSNRDGSEGEFKLYGRARAVLPEARSGGAERRLGARGCGLNEVLPEARSGGAERRLGARGCGFYEVSPEKRRVYAQTLSEKLGFDLEEEEEDWHLFAVDIESAAFVIIADEKQSVQVWP